eukprot:jgi/Orpsp1_1/1176477/evm.model.c7180000057787.1
MKLKILFKNLKYAFLISYILTKSLCNSQTTSSETNECTEIEKYIIEKNLSYDSVIRKCAVDENGKVIN